jgi:hypothetical protein
LEKSTENKPSDSVLRENMEFSSMSFWGEQESRKVRIINSVVLALQKAQMVIDASFFIEACPLSTMEGSLKVAMGAKGNGEVDLEGDGDVDFFYSIGERVRFI